MCLDFENQFVSKRNYKQQSLSFDFKFSSEKFFTVRNFKSKTSMKSYGLLVAYLSY